MNRERCLEIEKFLSEHDEQEFFVQFAEQIETWKDIRNDSYNFFIFYNCVHLTKFAWKYCRVEPEIIVDEHLPRYRLNWQNNEASLVLATEMYTAMISSASYNAVSYLERSLLYSNCTELIFRLNISFDNSSFVSLAKYPTTDFLYSTLNAQSKVLNYNPVYYEQARAYFRS